MSTLNQRSVASLFRPASEASTSYALLAVRRRCRSGGLACVAQYAKDPRGSGSGPAGPPTGTLPTWRPGAYDYPPPPTSAPRQPSMPPPPPPGGPSPNNNNNGGSGSFTRALIAAAFVTGVGIGVYFDSNITLSPTNVASTEIVDRRTPNSELCMAYGYSAMAFDQRLFVSFNPFNVYVSQPEVKPGCILRRSNVNVLEGKKLVTSQQVDTCKRAMNTFAFVGDLDNSPEVSCVYHSEEAENQYLLNPKRLVPAGEPASAVGGQQSAVPGGDAQALS
ncbi:hypothetical protein Vretimale_3265 [Volvox reticuliferus]|uniref:Uncharacterized protein n=1 Tax=Volvox reticuliferus TaxID=1737510 RepID=A0A8J4C764_9CHLO|nr:hypothetical protein Vretifemale_6550 [Volvox reticuliferus]GIL97675.1 hypothetical protein Vretimale_3265 [Volvox reticuliferus]